MNNKGEFGLHYIFCKSRPRRNYISDDKSKGFSCTFWGFSTHGSYYRVAAGWGYPHPQEVDNHPQKSPSPGIRPLIVGIPIPVICLGWESPK